MTTPVNTEFVSGTTITSDWLNGVNDTIQGLISVRQFGAKGDGVTDDTVALQNAFNYIKVNGGNLNIPGGTYLTGSLSLSGSIAGFTISGDGMTATTLKHKDGSGSLISCSSALTGFTLENFGVDCQYDVFISPTANHGISIGNVSDTIVQNVIVKNYKNTGILFYVSDAEAHTNCYVLNCRVVGGNIQANNGILFDSYINSRIDNCSALDINGSPGYAFQLKNYTYRSSITNCSANTAKAALAFGQQVDPIAVQAATCSNIAAFNCQTGIIIGKALHCVLSNCSIDMDNQGENAVQIEYSNEVSLDNILVTNIAPNKGAVRFRANSNKNTIGFGSISNLGVGSKVAIFDGTSDTNRVTINQIVSPDNPESMVLDSYVSDVGIGNTVLALYDLPRILGESISVKDFGAVGDGVTDDTASVQNAVLYCYSNNTNLLWPIGEYLTTASIPYFRSIVHAGNGVIKRGSDYYYIQPKDTDTNTIYVAADGADTNDGLSSSFPIKTLSAVKTALINVGADSLGGTYVIKFAAGTYSDSTNFTDLPQFRNTLHFIGEGTSRTPLTIFDGTSAAYQTACLYFQDKVKVQLQYLKFINFTTGYGAYAQWNCHMDIYDCDADNCLIGFSGAYSTYIRCERTLANNCSNAGYRVSYNSQGTLGPGSGGSLVDSARATNCLNGFSITRSSVAHIDYCEAFDCTAAGVVIDLNGRTAMLGGDYQRNEIAIRVWSGGSVNLSNSEPVILNQGDVLKRNVETFEYRGGGMDTLRGQSGTTEIGIYHNTTPTTVSGTLTTTQIGGTLYTAPAGWFIDNTKRVVLKCFGIVTTTATGTVSLQLKLAGTALSVLSIPINVTAQPFTLDVEVVATAYNEQRTISTLNYNGGSTIVDLQLDIVDCLTADRAFTFFSDANGDAACSITFNSVVFSVVG